MLALVSEMGLGILACRYWNGETVLPSLTGITAPTAKEDENVRASEIRQNAVRWTVRLRQTQFAWGGKANRSGLDL